MIEKSVEIFVGLFYAKFFNAIMVNPYQILFGDITQLVFTHRANLSIALIFVLWNLM